MAILSKPNCLSESPLCPCRRGPSPGPPGSAPQRGWPVSSPQSDKLSGLCALGRAGRHPGDSGLRLGGVPGWALSARVCFDKPPLCLVVSASRFTGVG